jgi:uncharacterized protein YjbI with pentapeptide repeats
MSVKARALNKRYLLAGLLSLLALALLITPALGAEKAAKKPGVQKVSLLYALNAGSGTLKKGKGARYKLTLKGLDRNVTWFSDRPVRRTSSFPIADLAESWQGFGFAADPPNAALTYTDRSGNSARTVILELSHPRFAKGKLFFAARALDPKTVKGPNLTHHAAGADRSPARRFTDASLFLDDTEAPIVDGCIVQPQTFCGEMWFSSGVNLAGADLEGAEMAGAHFTEANLTGVNFAGANLEGAGWSRSNLTEANFYDADLSGAGFYKSSLVKADLQWTKLSQTDFYEVDLEYANLTNATFLLYREPRFERTNVCYVTWNNGKMFEPPCDLP